MTDVQAFLKIECDFASQFYGSVAFMTDFQSSDLRMTETNKIYTYPIKTSATTPDNEQTASDNEQTDDDTSDNEQTDDHTANAIYGQGQAAAHRHAIPSTSSTQRQTLSNLSTNIFEYTRGGKRKRLI
jgi:hypothetical protein